MSDLIFFFSLIKRSLIDQKRQQAMDMHLSFIVDQTEKYSSWLIESLATNANKDTAGNSQLTPNTSIGTDEPANTTEDEDIEFDGDKIDTESDDESTIAKEWQYFKDSLDTGLKADPTRSDRLERWKRAQEAEKLQGMDVDKDGEDADADGDKTSGNGDGEGELDSLGTTDLSETDEESGSGDSEAENDESSSSGRTDKSDVLKEDEEMDAGEDKTQQSHLKGILFFNVQGYTNRRLLSMFL